MNLSASVPELAAVFHELWYTVLCINNPDAMLHELWCSEAGFLMLCKYEPRSSAV